jgi:hypothetical protein
MWLEKKYINLLSSQLRNFKQKNSNLWNCSCPMCGDSKTDSKRARMYIYYNGSFRVHCHNCAYSNVFNYFLKHINPTLHDEYIKERFNVKEKEPEKPKEVPVTAFVEPEPEIVVNEDEFMDKFKSLRTIDDLKMGRQLHSLHPAHLFLVNRFIPTDNFSELRWCENFKQFTHELLPDKYEEFNIDEERILIPLIQNNKLIGYQGRSIDPKNPLRYITIMFDKQATRFYGLDKVNFNKTYYVTEGPFDSMFVDNCIASCGGSILREIQKLNRVPKNAVIMYDNEPRNFEVIKNMKRAIDAGFSIVIWPGSVTEKDINDVIIKEITVNYNTLEFAKTYIQNIIQLNTYNALDADLALRSWARVRS